MRNRRALKPLLSEHIDKRSDYLTDRRVRTDKASHSYTTGRHQFSAFASVTENVFYNPPTAEECQMAAAGEAVGATPVHLVHVLH